MFVKLSITGQVTLEDRDNFRAFKLVIEGEPTRLDQAKRALANIAEIEDQTHAWIFEQALRQRPEVSGDATWQANLGVMMEKAKPHGWIDEQKKAIKAHIEWVASA
jgi:predicted transcriptional regulator